MKTSIQKIILILCIGLAALGLSASDAPRVDHFKGKPAPTLEIALRNLATYNARLAELLVEESLTPQAMVEIHQLSYTLENALETIAREHARLAELLEEVHVASERFDAAAILASGKTYLTGSEPLIRATTALETDARD